MQTFTGFFLDSWCSLLYNSPCRWIHIHTITYQNRTYIKQDKSCIWKSFHIFCLRKHIYSRKVERRRKPKIVREWAFLILTKILFSFAFTIHTCLYFIYTYTVRKQSTSLIYFPLRRGVGKTMRYSTCVLWSSFNFFFFKRNIINS